MSAVQERPLNLITHSPHKRVPVSGWGQNIPNEQGQDPARNTFQYKDHLSSYKFPITKIRPSYLDNESSYAS